MCIRDSHQVGHGALGGVEHLPRLLQLRRVVGVVDQLQRQPCLLYTSDAADERSSVDLGGRRIIKKKKTTAKERAPEVAAGGRAKRSNRIEKCV